MALHTKFIFIKPNGIISHTMLGQVNFNDGEIYGDTLCKKIETELTDIDIVSLYFWDHELSKLQNHGGCPSIYHEFVDYTWQYTQNSLANIKSMLNNEINQKRYEFMISPINYNGIIVDADSVAKDNILGKLQEIQIKETLNLSIPPEELFWRDHNNLIHTWETMEEYKLWLQGLLILISERATKLYKISWEKKEEIKLKTIDDLSWLLSYDATLGWNDGN